MMPPFVQQLQEYHAVRDQYGDNPLDSQYWAGRAKYVRPDGITTSGVEVAAAALLTSGWKRAREVFEVLRGQFPGLTVRRVSNALEAVAKRGDAVMQIDSKHFRGYRRAK
jgi:hypothetical protein